MEDGRRRAPPLIAMPLGGTEFFSGDRVKVEAVREQRQESKGFEAELGRRSRDIDREVEALRIAVPAMADLPHSVMVVAADLLSGDGLPRVTDSAVSERDEWISPHGRLVRAIMAEASSRATFVLRLLTFSAARRALPCWNLYCDDKSPHRAVSALHGALRGDCQEISRNFTVPATPRYRGKPIRDCRWCDTSAAAESVADAVKFHLDNNPLDAVHTLDAAEAAFDQSPLSQQENFRAWLITVAIPAAFDGRELRDADAL